MDTQLSWGSLKISILNVFSKNGYLQQKLVSPMPLKSPKLKWMAVGGLIVGFMAVLKYTGNLNKTFFIDWFKKIPSDVQQRPALSDTETSFKK